MIPKQRKLHINLTKYQYLVLFFVFVVTCSWRAQTTVQDYTGYIKSAINKFIRSGPLRKKDKVFSVRVKDFGDVIGVSIYGSTMKPAVLQNGNKIDLSPLPTRYIDTVGKLFYWDDDKIHASPEEVVAVLKKYSFIDTAILNIYIPPYFIDERKKGEHYYFCKNKIENFKKVRTDRAMGHYALPKLDCNR